MNKKLGILLAITSVCILTISFKCNVSAKEATETEAFDKLFENKESASDTTYKEGKNEAVINTLMGAIQQGHYSPRDVNDDFSEKVYDKFLERLDYYKQFFIQNDIDELSNYRTKIDDELKAGSVEFYNKAIQIFNKRKAETEKLFSEAVQLPVEFASNEKIQLDGKKLDWAKDQAALKDRWRLQIKYKELAFIDALQTEQNKKQIDIPKALKTATGTALDSVKKLEKDFKILSQAQLQDSAKRSVTKNMEYYFRRIKKTSNNDYFSTFINAITDTEDPHTSYFAPKEKQKFDEQISGTFFGIGAVLQSKDGVCTISSIVSGSPCWKQGSLKADDIILKVAQGADEPVDIASWDLDDVVAIIRGKKGTEVRLTTKHKNGNVEIIPIIRDEVHQEDTYAKSLIINNGKNKIGYIFLPEFYVDFNKADGGRRCSKDIKAEVEKLKAEGVDGMIMDLRYNGGGSLSDVVDIASLFVGNGPVVQVRSKDSDPEILRSRNNNILYSGPLAIMINSYSASASEILAAALQDYKRAIIVGSTSYGKGSVQRVYNLDEVSASDKAFDPLGSLKLTVQKFYRVNGASTQLKGVTPDIVLPDVYMLLDGGERKEKSAMAYDNIPPSPFVSSNSLPNYKSILSLSNKRVAANPYYKIIEEKAKQIKKQQDDNIYSLNAEKFHAQVEEQKAFAKQIEDLDKDKTLFAVSNPSVDMDKIKADETNKKKNEDWLKGIKKDINLSETVNIVSDIISTK